MLQADKDVVEARTAVNILSIREKELALYTRNTNLLGTVSAIMAGIGYFGLIYVKMGYYRVSGPISQFFYVNGLTISMCLALRNLLGTTLIAVMGPGLALRGGQGSMHRAIDNVIVELETVTNTLHHSIYCFMFTLIAYSWGGASPHWLCSIALTAIAIATAGLISWSTNKVEDTFPVRTMKLTSGAFFTSLMKRRQVRTASATPPLPAPGLSAHTRVGWAPQELGTKLKAVNAAGGFTGLSTKKGAVSGKERAAHGDGASSAALLQSSSRAVADSLCAMPSSKLIPYHSERMKAYAEGEDGEASYRREEDDHQHRTRSTDTRAKELW